MRNLLKVNNTDFRETSMPLFWCLYCCFEQVTPSSTVFIVNFDACWDDNDDNNDDHSHDEDVDRTDFTTNFDASLRNRRHGTEE